MLGLTSVCVFLFSALALAVTSGYSFGALVLLLASTCLLWKRPRLNLQRRDYLMLGTLLLYFLIFTANMLYHGDPARELDMPLRALLAVPVLLLLMAYPPRPEAWWSGLAIGAIARRRPGCHGNYSSCTCTGRRRPPAMPSTMAMSACCLACYRYAAWNGPSNSATASPGAY